jgi:hypothetical protein
VVIGSQFYTHQNFPRREKQRKSHIFTGIHHLRPDLRVRFHLVQQFHSMYPDFGRITGNPHLTRRWPFGRVTEGLPTTQPEPAI